MNGSWAGLGAAWVAVQQQPNSALAGAALNPARTPFLQSLCGVLFASCSNSAEMMQDFQTG